MSSEARAIFGHARFYAIAYPDSPVDGVVVHTEHEEYATVSAADFPGVLALVDGRNVTDVERWDGVARKVLGISSQV